MQDDEFHPGKNVPIQVQPSFQSAIVVQPGQDYDDAPLLQAQQSPTGCPQGLEYLMAVDQLLVHQNVEILDVLIGRKTGNMYDVKNSFGQNVYKALERRECCELRFCGMRTFEMEIRDNYDNHVLHLYCPSACQKCCFPCCLQSMEVSSPPGTIIGTVQQTWSIFKPHFDIKDDSDNVVLKIVGPHIFKCSCFCNDVVFKIFAADGVTLLGNICKQWTGCCQEYFTDADNFSVTFPMDLDVKMKAVLLGACFLIDFMYFEKSSGNKRRNKSSYMLF